MYDDVDKEYQEQIEEAQRLVRDGTLLAARVIKHGKLITMELVAPAPDEYAELTLETREEIWGLECEDDEC